MNAPLSQHLPPVQYTSILLLEVVYVFPALMVNNVTTYIRRPSQHALVVTTFRLWTGNASPVLTEQCALQML